MKLVKLCVSVVAALSVATHSLGQTAYASHFRTIKAGILIIAGNSSANAAPHIFNNLDQDVLVKPASWNFENPTAPTQVTQTINNRWTDSTLGTAIRKDNAAYWEVSLADLSDAQLGEYDVLALPCYGNLLLTGNEAARLRKFVDNGGTLWVDVDHNTTADTYNGLPLSLQLQTTSGTRLADFLHPIMNRPYTLTMTDLRAAEELSDGTSFGLPVSAASDSVLGNAIPFSPVALQGSYATIGAAPLGNGYVVLTTRGLGRVINQSVGSSTNNSYLGGTPLINLGTVAASKIIVNAISLNSSHNQVAQGSRANHGSTTDLGAPLLPNFSLPNSALGSTARPPVYYKGLMVVTSEDTLYVFSAKPGSTLDGTTTVDYGLTDYSLGNSYDLIWKTQLTGPISTPLCIEAPGATANGLPKDQVLVVDGTGALLAFDAFQLDGSGHIRDNTSLTGTPPATVYNRTPSSGSAAPVFNVPNAPVYHEGVVYIADNQSSAGRLWMVNPATGTIFNNGTNEFVLGGTAAATFNNFTSAPTVGYIPVQDNSGAMDKVAYIPAVNTSTTDSTARAMFYSVWVGVKGETYSIGTGDHDAQVSGSDLLIPVRAYDQGVQVYKPSSTSDPLGLHIAAVHKSTGLAYTSSELSSLFDGTWTPNISSRYISVHCSGDVSDVGSIRVDYTIDWGDGPTLSSSIMRSSVILIDDTTHLRRILGNIALTPSGNIVMVLSQGTPPLEDPTSTTAMNNKGGAVYNFTEKGRGLFRLNYRFEAYDAHIIQTNQGDSKNYPEAFTDNDAPVVSSLNNSGYSNPIQNLTFTSPPTVRDGAVYVTAVGYQNTSASDKADWIPVSVVAALKENPDPPVIYTSDLGSNFQIVQPDITGSDDKGTPTHFNILQPSQYTYTKDSSSTLGVLSISNMMDRESGAIGNTLSSNQPLLIRIAGAPDQLIEPDAASGGSGWNPMLWYAVFPGYHLDGASLVTGDTLFSSGWSVLPGAIEGLPSLLGTRKAAVVAMNTAVGGADSGDVVSDARRSWLKQVHTFSGTSIAPSDSLLWPTGFFDADSLAARVGQQALGASATAVHVTGGDGQLAITGDQGIYTFDSSSLVVADSSRVARFTPAGEALWSSENTYASGSMRDEGLLSKARPLVTPTRAYSFKSDTVIVDAGANRIIRVSDTGRESRSIDRVQLDPGGYRPDGFQAGEPLTFNHPNDVAAFGEYVQTGDLRLAKLSSPSSVEYWVHYMVADTGNHRLVDVIDRLYADPTTGEIGEPIQVAGVAQVGILLWHSPSVYSGKNWSYNSIARTQIVDTSGTTPVTTDVIAAGIGNSATTPAGMGVSTGADLSEGTGNGSIVLFNGAASMVINRVKIPAISGDVFWNGSTYGPDSQAARYRKLGSLMSVTMSRSGSSNYPLVMFTDASGVYEVEYDGTDWVVRWMLPKIAYTSMRGTHAPYGGTGQPSTAGAPNGNPVGLWPTFARRLDGSHVLVVNGMVSNEFHGEVVILDGTLDTTNDNTIPGFGFGKTNLGFGTNSVKYHLQDVKGARGIQGPVFADRR